MKKSTLYYFILGFCLIFISSIDSACCGVIELRPSGNSTNSNNIDDRMLYAGSFKSGSYVSINVHGIIDFTWRTFPDGSIEDAQPFLPPHLDYIWEGNSGYSTLIGGDGINHYVGGGASYYQDINGTPYFCFANNPSTDTTKPVNFRLGAVVGVILPEPVGPWSLENVPKRTDEFSGYEVWSLIGNGKTIKFPWDCKLYLAINRPLNISLNSSMPYFVEIIPLYTQELLDQTVSEATTTRDQIITNLNETIASKDQTIAAMFTQQQLDQAVADANAAKNVIIAQRDQTISTLNTTINSMYTKAQLDEAVANANAAKDLIIGTLNSSIAAKDETIASMYTKAQLDQAVADANAIKDTLIAQKNQIIASMFTQQQVDQAVANANAVKDTIITQKNQIISELNETISSMFTKSQLDQAVSNERNKWDVSGDGKIGLEDAINALQIVAGIRTSFSNQILSGPWISIETPNENEVYMIFDGQGIISEMGAFNIPSPAGTYQVQSTGAVTMNLGALGSSNGNLVSSNELQTSFSRLIRVVNKTTCQGTWSGTLTSQNIYTPSPPSPSIQFSVDANGVVTSFTGLASPVAGKIFCESNKVVAHFTTAETNSYNEIVFNGTLSNNSISGNYFVDNGSANDLDGTLTLNRQ